MKCKYIYKGHTFDSEAALDDFLIEVKSFITTKQFILNTKKYEYLS